MSPCVWPRGHRRRGCLRAPGPRRSRWSTARAGGDRPVHGHRRGAGGAGSPGGSAGLVELRPVQTGGHERGAAGRALLIRLRCNRRTAGRAALSPCGCCRGTAAKTAAGYRRGDGLRGTAAAGHRRGDGLRGTAAIKSVAHGEVGVPYPSKPLSVRRTNFLTLPSESCESPSAMP